MKRAAVLYGLARCPEDHARALINDATMVSLDLAILYLKEDRMAEVQRLAEEMLPR